MFDANVGVAGADNGNAEDTRLYGYDPMIPPALIQEEIPAVCPIISIPFCQSSFSVSGELTL